jgi:cysteinyl-tRNA synthetase
VLAVTPAQEEGLSAELQALLDQRAASRTARDWAGSDRLRVELAERGVLVEDTRDGQRWRRAD